ncbi:hypothetical protein [Marinicella sp. W31]|uniref:hypothetical protein n=1 Tax=Marinicella sp. W31 TaxID=3023713 RepID=UPI0037582BDA
MLRLVFVSFLFWFSNHAQAVIDDILNDTAVRAVTIENRETAYQFGGFGVIYSNGPISNSEGTGVGGADESILQNFSLGLSSLGFGHQSNANLRVADEFQVSQDGLVISSVEFFAYQTNETASTITSVNLRIWNGQPGQPGSQIIFGDTSTNRLLSTQNTGILRVAEQDSGISNVRQIASSLVDVNITLDRGTYWLDWQSDGSGVSGPWVPPITITGSTSTGNAIRSQDNGATYFPLVDDALATGMGLPFVLRGALPPPQQIPSLSILGLLLMACLLLISYRVFARYSY